jgi:tetratricopeptide (TPR) repeat protein
MQVQNPMSYAFRYFLPVLPSACITWVAVALFLPLPVFSQTAACAAIAQHPATPADIAYSEGNYRKAEDLYGEELAKSPHDLQLSAALVHTWLHQGEVSQASAQVNKMIADDGRSTATLSSLAEVQLHQGQPWEALETLNRAAASDPCYARIHLIRSYALRIDSMYASERAEIQNAYDIDPTDPDIRHAWLSIVSPAHELASIDQSLSTMKDLDPETRQKAQASIDSMLPMLSENNQTCKILPAVSSATLPLLPSYQDAKHIDGYRLDVEFPQGKARLQVDTAASGLYISRALADRNGFQPEAGEPPGTVHVDSVHIGPLEFRDCTVGVSDTPFPGQRDGFIGTDMFASYLITLDHPSARLTLAALPHLDGILPGDRFADRVAPPELRGFTPVYHRRQYLVVPVLLDNKLRKLFVLDSGIRLSTMTSEVAHAVSNTRMNFTNPLKTVSGSTIQIYRDSFDFQIASLSLNHQGHILEFDPSAIDQSAGFEIAGMLGFDMLHSLTLHLDYRDGLVKFESTDAEVAPGNTRGAMTASASGASANEAGKDGCKPDDTADRPLSSTLEAKVTGLFDSGHMKPGRPVAVTIVHEWLDPECRLSEGAILYGHVTASSSTKDPDASELGLLFDHGDCVGHEKQALSLRVIGVVAPPDSFVGLQAATPTEVSGRGRGVSTSAAGVSSFALVVNLNPEGPPNTIHPGIVAGIPKMKLDPLGGPGCSARLTSSERSLRLGTGTELIMTRQAPVKP